MNAVAGSIFYYSLKYSNIKISGVFLIMIAVLFMLFHTHASNLNSFVRDILFYFALGAGIYIYIKFVPNQFIWILRILSLTAILAVSETILFYGIQSIIWLAVRGINLELEWYRYEFYIGTISGFGLGVGIEITNLITTKFSAVKKENLSTESH